jgi:hypothetical protein
MDPTNLIYNGQLVVMVVMVIVIVALPFPPWFNRSRKVGGPRGAMDWDGPS